MMEAFRFIHTTQLRLDQQLSGLRQWSGLDRSSLRDCTLQSFSKIVDACLTRDVDLLLITGDCWAVDNLSVRAAFALQQSCLKLSGAGVAVCLAVSDRKQFEEGLCGLTLPETVVVLDCDQFQSATVVGAGGGRARLQTMFRSDAPSPVNQHGSTGGPGAVAGPEMAIGITNAVDRLLIADTPFSIVGGVPLDHRFEYIAASHPGRQRTLLLGNNVVHSPGPAQGLAPHETGMCGCTLVEWSAGDEPRLTQIPTAPFRWEQWAVDLGPNDGPDALRRKMLNVVQQHCGNSPDATWLVRWNLNVEEWPDAIGSDLETTADLLRDLDREAQGRGIRLASQSVLLLSVGESEASRGDSLDGEFERMLATRFPPSRDAIKALGADVASRLAANRSEAERVLSTLSPVRVANEARATGRRWLVRTEAADA